MKNVLIAAVFMAGLGLTACSSDDDNPAAETNLLVGEWKAETVSYVRPDNGQTMTHDFSMITNGCDVDEIEIRTNNTVELETESKVNESCVESHTMGTWNDTLVSIEGEETAREVISVTPTELVLKYNMTWGYGTTDVTVTYSKS